MNSNKYRLKISERQKEILRILIEKSYRQNELQQLMGITSPGLLYHLNILEKYDLIVKKTIQQIGSAKINEISINFSQLQRIKEILDLKNNEYALIPKENDYVKDEIYDNEERHDSEDDFDDLKIYLREKLRSPLIIIPLAIILFAIIISIFPQILTPYHFEQIITPHPGAFYPPSPDHPLGQGRLGRDVLAQIVYATKDVLINGFGAVLIGMIGGLPFMILKKKFKHKRNMIFFGIIIIYYMFLTMIVIMLVAILPSIGIGIFLIPPFSHVLASRKLKKNILYQRLIMLVPFFAAIAILLQTALPFLGFPNSLTTNFGNILNGSRGHLFDAPWASLWPGTTLFALLLALILISMQFRKYRKTI